MFNSGMCWQTFEKHYTPSCPKCSIAFFTGIPVLCNKYFNLLFRPIISGKCMSYMQYFQFRNDIDTRINAQIDNIAACWELATSILTQQTCYKLFQQQFFKKLLQVCSGHNLLTVKTCDFFVRRLSSLFPMQCRARVFCIP